MAKTLIIGGGPAGSTVGGLLKKYHPEMDVVILEREVFPRDHVGESLLPKVCQYLDELEVWDEMERAEFPIKIGATYRWGKTDDLWDFNFIPDGKLDDEPRPGKFAGQRAQTAFQVDRAVYDEILLNKAESRGCEVRQNTRVVKILKDGDKITGVEIDGGEVITADYFVDASGHTGVLRRGMEIECDYPKDLQNVAFWDYWQDTDWAVNIGQGGTRVQVLSQGWGWIWFIPISPTRTSIGLILPADHYKKLGKKPEELYREALDGDPRVKDLLQNATCEEKFTTTTDWSFVAKRLYGENWFLVGEAAGFADPVLAAGLTLTHSSAREAAYIIMALDKGFDEPDALKKHYEDVQAARTYQHIRFAQFWYTANGLFTDLKDYTSKIADDAGLELDSDQAFQWLGTGGFVNDGVELAGIGGYNVSAVKTISQTMLKDKATWSVGKCNVFELALEGSDFTTYYRFENGEVVKLPCIQRGEHKLPLVGAVGILIEILDQETHIVEIRRQLWDKACEFSDDPGKQVSFALDFLEGMIHEGWIKASINPELESMDYETLNNSPYIRANNDEEVGHD
jgi:flavin-dependent dehydrogenase